MKLVELNETGYLPMYFSDDLDTDFNHHTGSNKRYLITCW